MDSLQHHGILGQKWGIRRYQKKDGTLTRAGKKRLAKLEEEKKALEPTPAERAKKMTDKELQEAINRMRLEKQYTDFFAPDKKEEKKPSVIKTALGNAAKNAVNKIANDAANEIANELTNKIKNRNKKEILAKDYRLEDADRMVLSQLKTANEALSQLDTYRNYFSPDTTAQIVKNYHVSDVSKMTLAQLTDANEVLKQKQMYVNYLVPNKKDEKKKDDK